MSSNVTLTNDTIMWSRTRSACPGFLARRDHLRRRHLDALRAVINDGPDDGSLRPTFARVFTLEEVGDTHRFMEAGDQIGKIIVIPQNSNEEEKSPNV